MPPFPHRPFPTFIKKPLWGFFLSVWSLCLGVIKKDPSFSFFLCMSPVEVFVAYYKTNPPGVSFSQNTVNQLLSTLLSQALLRDLVSVISTLLKHKRTVSKRESTPYTKIETCRIPVMELIPELTIRNAKKHSVLISLPSLACFVCVFSRLLSSWWHFMKTFTKEES